MDTLTALNQQLRQLRDKKSDIQDDINKYEKRKKEVNAIISNTTKVADDDYSDVNDYCKKISDTIYDALKGVSQAGVIDTSVTAAKESGSGSDSNVSQALSELRSEISKINDKLDTLNGNLSSVNTQIDNTKYKIQREKERKAQEALAAAAKALSG